MGLNYNDGQWHGWNGGECPLHSKTIVELRYEDPSMILPPQPAGNKRAVRWTHESVAKIIAFRVIKEHKEPREFWLHELSGRFCNVPCDSGCCIHVREVLK